MIILKILTIISTLIFHTLIVNEIHVKYIYIARLMKKYIVIHY